MRVGVAMLAAVVGWAAAGSGAEPPPRLDTVAAIRALSHGTLLKAVIATWAQLITSHLDCRLAQSSWLNVSNLVGMAIALLLVVLVVGAWGATMRRKVHRKSQELARRIEAEAVLERRRSRILEDINTNRPLTEVLEQIAELVSYRVDGTHCWIRIGSTGPAGNSPQTTGNMQLLRQEIRSPSGTLHGTLFAALAPGAAAGSDLPEALAMGAGLAILAIETRGLHSDLIHRSEFDQLTDVHNRSSLEKHLDRLIDDTRRERGRFGLIYIDLDNFKQLNDRYSHRVGDLYLQEAADRMRRQLRPGDMLARLGGDEFAALVPHVRSLADIEETATRIDRCFDEPFLLEGYSLRGSASVGIAVFPENGVTRDTLLNTADSAMHNAKHRKRRFDAAARSNPAK